MIIIGILLQDGSSCQLSAVSLIPYGFGFVDAVSDDQASIVAGRSHQVMQQRASRAALLFRGSSTASSLPGWPPVQRSGVAVP